MPIGHMWDFFRRIPFSFSWTRATVEVNHFIYEVPQMGSLRPPPPEKKPDLKKNKTDNLDDKSHGLGTQRQITQKRMTYSRRFGVKEPCHSENEITKKRYTSCRSMRSRWSQVRGASEKLCAPLTHAYGRVEGYPHFHPRFFPARPKATASMEVYPILAFFVSG